LEALRVQCDTARKIARFATALRVDEDQASGGRWGSFRKVV
jgi:hypothetical protein